MRVQRPERPLGLVLLAALLALPVIPALPGCAVESPEGGPETEQAQSPLQEPPRGRHVLVGEAGGASRGAAGTIVYHGGPVMLGTTGVYYIWYGNWANDTGPAILTDLAQNLGGSHYYGINASYYDGSSTHVSNALAYLGSTTDAYSQGTSLTSAGVLAVVSTAISSGRLPADSHATYFVLTSGDVAQGGFCSSYCGWHTHATIAGVDVKYAFVGDPTACMSACAAQRVGPNGNAGADAMASIVAHELEEMVTDPDLNAWYDRRGQENADKCAWTFGTTYSAGNGARANVRLGTRDYLIQQNWLNVGSGRCSMSD